VIQPPTKRTQDDNVLRASGCRVYDRQLQVSVVLAGRMADDFRSCCPQGFHFFWGERVKIADYDLGCQPKGQAVVSAAVGCDDQVILLKELAYSSRGAYDPVGKNDRAQLRPSF
jgi:hypothetical protein